MCQGDTIGLWSHVVTSSISFLFNIILIIGQMNIAVTPINPTNLKTDNPNMHYINIKWTVCHVIPYKLVRVERFWNLKKSG